jgi:hypothetical protein
MVTQSAADGLVEEPAVVELAGADTDAGADVAGVETEADVAEGAGVELDDELDEVQPAMRALLAARTARTVSDEPLDNSGTSMGAEHEQNHHRPRITSSQVLQKAGVPRTGCRTARPPPAAWGSRTVPTLTA